MFGCEMWCAIGHGLKLEGKEKSQFVLNLKEGECELFSGCRNKSVERIREDEECAEWSESDRERQIPYDFISVWNLKN